MDFIWEFLRVALITFIEVLSVIIEFTQNVWREICLFFMW